MLRTLQQSSSWVWGECCIPGAWSGARWAVCLGRRELGGADPGLQELGLGPGRGQGWKHVVTGWSWGCGSGRARAQGGRWGSLLCQQGHWAQAELGMIAWWHLLAF